MDESIKNLLHNVDLANQSINKMPDVIKVIGEENIPKAVYRFLFSKTHSPYIKEFSPNDIDAPSPSPSKGTKLSAAKKGLSAAVSYTDVGMDLGFPFISSQSVLSYNNDSKPYHMVKQLEKENRSCVVYVEVKNAMLENTNFLKGISKLHNLRHISLTNIGLSSIPKALYKLPKSVTYLDFSKNEINDISQKVKWSSLQGLNLSYNTLKSWPEVINIVAMPSITYLSLEFNKLEKNIPDSTFKIPNLTYLNLAYCSLDEFPQIISSIDTLRILDLSGNKKIKDLKFYELGIHKCLKLLNICNLSSPMDPPEHGRDPPIIFAYNCPFALTGDELGPIYM